MLAPFFMKAHGYSFALAGIPLVANGIGRVSSDLLSGIMATYFSPGALLIAATAIGLATSAVGYLFLNTMPVFVGVWILFGLTEAMFALALRKIGFDQSAPERQGRVQGQMASASHSDRFWVASWASGSGPTAFFFFIPCLNSSVCFLFLSQAPNDTEKPSVTVRRPYGAKELFF
jgi:hypothetical protein